MQKKFKCRCGVESLEYEGESGGSVAAIAQQSGFDYVWNIQNGLSPIYMCQQCMKIVLDAYDTIVATVGTSYVNFTGIKKHI